MKGVMLFRFELRCKVCGRLTSRFTKVEYAGKASAAHKDVWTGLGESDHTSIIMDLDTGKEVPISDA